MSASAGVFGAAAADGFLTHQPGGDQQMSAVLWMQAALTLWAVIFLVKAAGTPCTAVDVHTQSHGAENKILERFSELFFFFNGTWKTMFALLCIFYPFKLNVLLLYLHFSGKLRNNFPRLHSEKNNNSDFQ